MSRLHWLVCALILVTSALAQEPAGKLKMAVIVTRHGVRPPLSQDTKHSKDEWPSLCEWGAKCAGDLTPAGFQLATLMGAYYREHYMHQGLLPNGCPSKQVSIWADNEERTLETSKAIAQGLGQPFSDCSVNVDFYNKLKDQKPTDPCASPYETDLFFHPLSSDTLKKNIEHKTMESFASNIQAKVPDLRRQYQANLAALQNVVKCCDPSECKEPQVTCTLSTLPDKVTVADDNTFKWTGPFSVGSTATENLLLEYANGMSCNTTGWGRVTYNYVKPDCAPAGGEPFRKMQEIHTAYFWALNRTKVDNVPYLARIQGSNLANQVLLKIEKGVAGSAPEPLVIYGGHDTNLGNIAGMLGLAWRLVDLPENDTPPAGALVFELYQRGPRDFYVKLRYVHATMAQMRAQSVLSLANPPEWSDVGICNPCSFSTFKDIMNGAIDQKFTTTGPGEND
jgi:4-phytase / acid phosphatase